MLIKNNYSNFTLVKQVTLENYRNYKLCTTNLEKFNILYGNNGSGKTNFLEAISLLSPGKGIRGVKFEELLNSANNNLKANFVIKSSLETNCIDVINEITNSVNSIESNSNKKNILLDNDPLKKIQNLPFYIRPLWLTPQMDTLFLEESRIQRNFFDRLIFNFDPSHLTRINAYNKALKERNTLLKNQSRNNSWFIALEDILATQGVSIAATRVDFIEKLNNFIQTKASSYFSNINLETDGFVENLIIKDALTALACENLLKEKLQTVRREDYRTGVTSLGVHKSNFNILNLNNNLFAKNCSTGEQKIILITIIISFIKLLLTEQNNNIVLLLDEILVHLDSNVREKLLEELITLNLQFIITTTDTGYFSNFENKLNFLKVENNKIF